jgi:hypothetical protein
MKTDAKQYFYSDLGWVDFVLVDRKPENTRTTAKRMEFLVDAGVDDLKRLRVHYRHAEAKKVSLVPNLRLVFDGDTLVSAEVIGKTVADNFTTMVG